MKKGDCDDGTATNSQSEKIILDLIERDFAAHPECLKPITAELVRRTQSLVESVLVDLELPLSLEPA